MFLQLLIFICSSPVSFTIVDAILTITVSSGDHSFSSSTIGKFKLEPEESASRIKWPITSGQIKKRNKQKIYFTKQPS